jgi:hypothetical protein
LKNADPTPLPTSKQLYATPNSPIWIARWIQESDHQSIALLHDWTHPKRQDEITNELVENLQQLTPKQSLHAIAELKDQKTYILGKGGNQLDIPLILQNPQNNQLILTNGLLDSGCTGSCIHEDFIRQHQIPTENLPRLIPIYNADGTSILMDQYLKPPNSNLR